MEREILGELSLKRINNNSETKTENDEDTSCKKSDSFSSSSPSRMGRKSSNGVASKKSQQSQQQQQKAFPKGGQNGPNGSRKKDSRRGGGKEEDKEDKDEKTRRNEDENDDDESITIHNNMNTSVAVVDVSFDAFIIDASNRIASQFDSKQVALQRDYEIQLQSEREEKIMLNEQMEDLMAALGEMTFVSAKQRWKFATKLILSKLKEQKATKNAERLRKRALSLEEQLRRVERHISNAAEDFDNLNRTLEKERGEMQRAKESEKFALEELRRKKLLLKQKDEEDKTLYNLSPSKMRVALREQVRKEILEEMRRDVGARVERITSSAYSGSTSPLSPDEYASTFDRLLLFENKVGEKKGEGGEAEKQQQQGNNNNNNNNNSDTTKNKNRESSSRRQAASEAARTIAKCVDELLSSTSSRLHKRNQQEHRHKDGAGATEDSKRQVAAKNIKMKLAENRNTLNDPTDVLRLMALSALEKSSK
jgi:hypothetical protein